MRDITSSLCDSLSRYALAALMLLCMLGPVAVHAEPEGGTRPNVLFIAVDDLKPTLGAYGDPYAVTPNIDRLAARGTTFTNAHCQQAVCAPSRVSVLTGLRPDATRVWDLQTDFRETIPDVITLPQLFKQAGYETVGMGKMFHSGGNSLDPISWSQPVEKIKAPAESHGGYCAPQIVAEVDARLAKRKGKLPKGWRAQIKAMFGNAGKPPTDRAEVADNAYHDGAMTDIAIQKLNAFQQADKPFFLAVGYKRPHLPFNAPARYWDMYDRETLPLAANPDMPQDAPDYAYQPGWELRSGYRVAKEGPIALALQKELIHGYYASVSYVDAQVGRLMETLAANGQDSNTVIVLWGDHGFHLGDHSMWCKHSNFEQATRSALLLVTPSQADKGTQVDAPVELLDIFPTLCDLAGVTPPADGVHGLSLQPYLHDADAPQVKPVAISQYARKMRQTLMGYSVRDQRYRLTVWMPLDANGNLTGEVADIELYDYEKDPHETRNIAGNPENVLIVQAMRRQLTQTLDGIWPLTR